MSADTGDNRYQFGQNWKFYLKYFFSEERLSFARNWFLKFLDRTELSGLSMIDIGCGSGIHSLAAWQGKVGNLVSFDYDPNSVEATRLMHSRVGSPNNWRVEQGSILDDKYISSLGTYDLVYSWGVLHHTGSQWDALDNAAQLVGPGGKLYIALYTGDVYTRMTPEYWIDVKKRYNSKGKIGRLKMEMEYIWEHEMSRSFSNIFRLPSRFADYKKKYRGMSLYVDARDWLGGWPMEYSSVNDVLAWAHKQGLTLIKIETGELNTEYLFVRGTVLPPHINLDSCFSVANRISDLPLDKAYYIYGNGDAGKILANHLKSQDLSNNLQGFIDTYQGGDVDGLPTLSPAAMHRFVDPSTPIIVCAAQYGQISMNLAQAGYTKIYAAHPISAKLLRVQHGAADTADI